MFEAVELGRKISNKDFSKLEEELRIDLLQLQESMKGSGFPVILLVTGDDNAGRGECINQLNEWLDPRFVATRAFAEPTEEEIQRPEFWRYWRALPPKGRIGIFFGSWYGAALRDRLARKVDDNGMLHKIARIKSFERMLVADGALVVKIWIHLGKDAIKDRVKKALKQGKSSWPGAEIDQQTVKNYDRGRRIAERMLMQTSTPEAPWTVIEGADANYRDITVAQTLRDAIKQRLTWVGDDRRTSAPAIIKRAAGDILVLDKVDLKQTIDKREYEKQLAKLQDQLAELQVKAIEKGQTTILMFEGWDAAGKGGTIRRIIHAMDARTYDVVPIAAPTEEERAHHYLWRFWRHLPRKGRVLIFDRSWYGRVLVERVEGFTPEKRWRAAYSEINDFEEQLVEHGYLLMKFFLHIGEDEQLRRFQERERTPWKKYKITEEDYRNRAKWGDYEIAIDELVRHTSTDYAPWHLISNQDKNVGRIEVLKLVVSAMKQKLKE